MTPSSEYDTSLAETIKAIEGVFSSWDEIESVLGTDDRSRITPTTSFPWLTICKIYIVHPNGDRGTGTGFLIDDFLSIAFLLFLGRDFAKEAALQTPCLTRSSRLRSLICFDN